MSAIQVGHCEEFYPTYETAYFVENVHHEDILKKNYEREIESIR